MVFGKGESLSHGHGLELNQTVSQHQNKLHSTTDLRAKGKLTFHWPTSQVWFCKKKRLWTIQYLANPVLNFLLNTQTGTKLDLNKPCLYYCTMYSNNNNVTQHLQGNYFVLSALSHLILKQTYKVGTIFILVLQVKRIWQLSNFCSCHMAVRRCGGHFNRGSLDSLASVTVRLTSIC